MSPKVWHLHVCYRRSWGSTVINLCHRDDTVTQFWASGCSIVGARTGLLLDGRRWVGIYCCPYGRGITSFGLGAGFLIICARDPLVGSTRRCLERMISTCLSQESHEMITWVASRSKTLKRTASRHNTSSTIKIVCQPLNWAAIF